MQFLLFLCSLIYVSVSAFTTDLPGRSGIAQITNSNTQLADVISPFDSSGNTNGSSTSTKEKPPLEGPLELTWENVDAVLDEMRHYLINDGGNVAIQEIDGPVVRLELQGNCGTCPSSTQTMKMGLGEFDGSLCRQTRNEMNSISFWVLSCCFQQVCRLMFCLTTLSVRYRFLVMKKLKYQNED